jgi:1,2-phenylacetyl-CoA epoxidase PaaB subunit
MKRKIFFILLILSIVTLICISCKTTPKDQPAPRQEQPRQNEAKTKADQARKQALDFSSDTYFPSEWEEAEKQYAEANDNASYNAAADTYNGLFKKAVPLYAQAREDEIMSAREELIATGFTDAFPQYLKKADDLALAAQDKYEAGDYYGAKDTASAALSEYKTLLTGAKTYVTRQEIINRGFTKYDSDNFSKADEISQKAIEAYDAGDKDKALANAEEAQLRYNIVLSNGWTVYSSERREAASKERELAIADKANIASRETFRKGEALLEDAKALYADEKYSEAALTFVDAEANYAISRKETEEKRIKAQEAMRIAGEKIGESNETAIEAEKIIEGGSK